MKFIPALTFVTAKLAYLVCFSVMGFIGNIELAQAEVQMPPCHTVAMEQDKKMEEPCSACMDSEKLWSQDLVFISNDIILQDVTLAALPFVEVAFDSELLETVRRDTVPDPPDIAFYASVLRTQKGIVLLD